MFITKFKKNKMNFLGKIVGLCFMALCVCAPSFFGLFRKETFALSKNVTNISSTTSLTAGSKVYFGEYPQDSVIKVSEEAGWEKITIKDSDNKSYNAVTIPQKMEAENFPMP